MSITRKFLVDWFASQKEANYFADHQEFIAFRSDLATLDGEWDLGALAEAINQATKGTTA